MKIVSDFNGVIFNNLALHEHYIKFLEHKGIDSRLTELVYMKHSETGIPFSLRRFLWTLGIRADVRSVLDPHVYDEILLGCKRFLNSDVLEVFSSINKKDIILLTKGDKEYELDKISKSVGNDFAGEVILLTDGKKEILRHISDTHKNETIIVVDSDLTLMSDEQLKRNKNIIVIPFSRHAINDFSNVIQKYRFEEKKQYRK